MDHRHGFPATDYPSPGVRTIPAAAEWARETYGAANALVDGAHTVTFGEYVDAARSIAKALIADGVEIGTPVAVWAPNSINFALVALGIHCAGATLVPINTRFVQAEVAKLVGEARPRVIFTVESFLDRGYASDVDTIYAGAPAAPTVVVLDADGSRSLATFVTRGESVSDHTLAARMAAVAPDDIGTILFTSGTTGRSKGVMLRHGALVRAYWTFSGAVGMRPGDHYLCVNPMFHAFGLKAGLLSALMRGMTLYPVSTFDPGDVLGMIERCGITYFPGPPTVFQDLLTHPALPRCDISSLRASVVGATALPPSIIRDMYDLLGFDEIHVPYGFTEGTGVATVTLATDPRRTIETTAGVPLPGIEVRIVGNDGSPAASGETGEILVDGYNRMAGYLNPADGTENDGPLHSGDLGSIDDQGYLTVRGRIKDMYITGGFNVYPAEVEAELLDMPGVDKVAVVGVPDDRLGEVGCAFIVRRPAPPITEAEVLRWCRERIANFKVPRSVVFASALPMNATGKVLKAELRAAYRFAGDDRTPDRT